MFFATLIALLTISFTISTEAKTASLNVSVYYECLCPDSVDFITEQLYPTYQKIPDFLDIRFIPFGNAEVTVSSTGIVEFNCQHGPDECYGNKIHSCAISIDPQNAIDFVNCAMASDDPSYDIFLAQCAKSSGISWDVIKECYDSRLGDQLLTENGLRTALVVPPVEFIPTIIFNNVYNQALQDSALVDFASTVCYLLDNEPSICGNLK